ncbi:MAG: alkaline phosphatase [Methylococcales bacterium]|nr:alkaline phosphatase [Methylococcales bacterium]
MRSSCVSELSGLGKATGLVSDTRITHATPAAFTAHETHRSQENNIPEDLLATDVDVMLSGGLSYWIPQQASDARSLIHEQLVHMTGNSVEIKSSRKDAKK